VTSVPASIIPIVRMGIGIPIIPKALGIDFRILLGIIFPTLNHHATTFGRLKIIHSKDIHKNFLQTCYKKISIIKLK
jgi:hypothetical protein